MNTSTLGTLRSADLKIVCLADTHLEERITVPNGDILIHAGDMTVKGSLEELRAFNQWLGTLPHRHKIVIAGNHDYALQNAPVAARKLLSNACYLQDDLTIVEGLRIWGSPWQPEHKQWAFNLPRGPELRNIWYKIPERVDILVTHCAPANIRDVTMRGENVGCKDLREIIMLRRPRLHIFGHIHEARGCSLHRDTLYVNAAICGWGAELPRAPIVVGMRSHSEATPVTLLEQ